MFGMFAPVITLLGWSRSINRTQTEAPVDPRVSAESNGFLRSRSHGSVTGNPDTEQWCEERLSSVTGIVQWQAVRRTTISSRRHDFDRAFRLGSDGICNTRPIISCRNRRLGRDRIGSSFRIAAASRSRVRGEALCHELRCEYSELSLPQVRARRSKQR